MKKLLLIIALTIFGLGLNAQNVGYETTIGYDGYSLKFKITSVEPAECEVSGRTGYPTEVTIPSTVTILITECSVTSIGERAFYGCSSLKSIEIPNSVTSIGENAFGGCYNLTSIEIPNSVTSIGERAFYGCSSLKSIEIPNSVTSIGFGVFTFCSSLTSIEIPNSVTSIGENAFGGCYNLTSIEIPNSVTSIGENAFSDCSSLTSIEIPNSVTSIGRYAFSYCSSLTSIEIPNSVTSIGDDAFSACSSLTSITFGENSQLTSIGNEAFSDCSSLTSIEIPNSVTSIGNEVFFGCSSLTSIVVAEGNTVYDSRENCNAIIKTSSNKLITGCQNTVIPNSVTSIGDDAFCKCSSLTSIEIPNSVTSIGDDAFYGCSSLTSIEIPNSVTSIGYWAFSECSSLTSIEIPNSVTSIGTRAFWGCSSLKVIKCYAEDVPETGDYVFDYCPSDMIIYVPEVSLEDYKSASPWNAFAILSLNEGPRNIIATTDSAFSVNLSWDNCYADSYNVYRNGDSIANVTNPTYTDICLEYNTEYCYTVTAVRNETETDKSEEVCAKTFDLPITTPENLVTEALSTSSIILTWDNVENALSYNVYRDGDSIANVTNPTYTDKDLEYNTKYCYTVTAVRNETESDKSEEKCAKTFDLPITTPENLVTEALSTSSIKLTWNEVENALNYNVYQANELIANIEETTFTVDGLEYNTEYCYTVTAVRNETETDKSLEVCATTFDLPITTPENLIATPTSASSVSLSWDAVEDADSYNVYRDGKLLKNVNTNSYLDEGLEAYTEYCYEITAVRNEIETDKSEEVCATTFDLPITTPENLEANALSASSIILTWNVVENAESYNVYRDGNSIANVANPTYTDKDLEYNTKYCYEVAAVRGDEESEKSKMVCAKTLGESIEELSSSINIYPNPVENDLFIATEVRVEEVSIYDIYGRLCCRDASNASTSNSMDTFNVSVQDLESGVYFVNVKTESGNIVKRFVKK